MQGRPIWLQRKEQGMSGPVTPVTHPSHFWLLGPELHPKTPLGVNEEEKSFTCIRPYFLPTTTYLHNQQQTGTRPDFSLLFSPTSRFPSHHVYKGSLQLSIYILLFPLHTLRCWTHLPSSLWPQKPSSGLSHLSSNESSLSADHEQPISLSWHKSNVLLPRYTGLPTWTHSQTAPPSIHISSSPSQTPATFG